MPDDEIDLSKNGTVSFTLADGTAVRLRRPPLGEYRQFREDLEERQDRTSDLRADLLERTQEASTPGRVLSRDENLELRRMGRELTRASEDARIAWLMEVCKVLTDGAVVVTEEITPAWFIDPEVPGTLTGHWRAMPGPRSGSE